MVLDVAGAAEQLDRVGGDLHGHVRGEALGRRAEEGQVGVLALGLGGGDVHHLASGLELHAHVGEHELQALELADGLAELLALLDVAQRVVQRALRDADRLGADGDAGVVEGAQRDLQALALGAHEPVGRDARVGEVQLAGRAALDAELALGLAEVEALVALLDDERRDVAAALAVGVGNREHGVELRLAGVGDPRLLAVEEVVVAVLGRPGAHGGGVRTGLALGQAVGEHRLAARHGRQVLALDLLAAPEDDRHRAELVDGRDERGRAAHPRDLLDDDAGRERVGPHTVVLLGDVRRVEVGGDEGVERLAREPALLVDLGGVGGDLALADRANGLAQRLVVLGGLEQVEVSVSGHPPMLAPCVAGASPAWPARPASGRSRSGRGRPARRPRRPGPAAR